MDARAVWVQTDIHEKTLYLIIGIFFIQKQSICGKQAFPNPS